MAPPETDPVVVLQALIMGARAQHRQDFATLRKDLSVEIQGLRQAILDLQQSLLRGRK